MMRDDTPSHIISAERLMDMNALASIAIKAAELIAMIDLAGKSGALDTARQHATEAPAWAERHFAANDGSQSPAVPRRGILR